MSFCPATGHWVEVVGYSSGNNRVHSSVCHPFRPRSAYPECLDLWQKLVIYGAQRRASNLSRWDYRPEANWLGAIADQEPHRSSE